MRKLLLSALLVLSLAALPAVAEAARTLPYKTATRYAKRAGASHARSLGAAAWEISPGFRFDRRKLVFAWYGQLADGRGCGAQLVVRYASRSSGKVIAYFRNQQCS